MVTRLRVPQSRPRLDVLCGSFVVGVNEPGRHFGIKKTVDSVLLDSNIPTPFN